MLLRNGYSLEAESHERDGSQVRLRMANGGWIRLPSSAVEAILPKGGEAVRETSESGQGKAADVERGPASLRAAINRFASEHGVPASLVRAVIWAESGFNPRARSPKGAVGLMQIMPSTAADLGIDPSDEIANIEGGTRYLGEMLARYAGSRDQLVRALAAYNAGPGRVAEFDGLPPFAETEAYVATVLRRFLASESGPQQR